jgi:hypothetical protein
VIGRSGKYNDLCTLLRERVRARGGVLLLIMGGERGNGLSIQATPDAFAELPATLRAVADQIEQDLRKIMPADG